MSQAHRFSELTNMDLIMDYMEHSLPNLPQSPEPERALARADQNSLRSGCCNSPSQRCNELPITFAFLHRRQARAQSQLISESQLKSGATEETATQKRCLWAPACYCIREQRCHETRKVSPLNPCQKDEALWNMLASTIPPSLLVSDGPCGTGE